jgi:phosphate transport system substrate-binding protein
MTLKAVICKLLSAVALLLIVPIAACASPNTGGGGGGSRTLTACHVTARDLSIPGGGKSSAPMLPAGTLNIDGSTALAPLFQQAAGNVSRNPANNSANNKVTINITPNGSGTGLTDVENPTVQNGMVQIGMSDVFAQEKATTPTSYSDLVDHQVAVVPFTLVVSQDISSQVENLTTKQIQDIYAGNITNWSQVGGPNEPITVVVRTKTSGTRATFDTFVVNDAKQTNDEPAGAQTADSTAELVTDISNSYGAIGYTGSSFVLNHAQSGKIFPICIDGAAATKDNINSGKYTFWNIEHAYTKETPASPSLTAAFLQYIQSSQFQNADLASLGFLKVDELSSAAKATHPVPTPAP